MEFAFTPEQEELRRQARSFLDANPDAPLAELRELGWLGVSVAEERGGGGLSFVDEAILFEEAGRALYSGPFLTTAVVGAAGGGRAGVVGRARRPRARPRRRRPRAARVDGGVRGRGRDARPSTRRASRWAACKQQTATRSTATSSLFGWAPRRPRRGGGRGRAEGARARRRLRLRARAVRQEDRHLPGRLAPAPRDTYVETELARSLAYWAAWCVAEEDERAPWRSRPRSRSAPRPPSPPASARSRCTAGSASPGSTSCTATTSAPSGSTRSAATPRSSASRRRCPTRLGGTFARPEG